MYCKLNMGHGKNKSQLLRLKEKVTQDSGFIALETSLDLISLYEKCYNVYDKSKKKKGNS